MRVAFWCIRMGKWNHRIRQYNLLVLSTRSSTVRMKKASSIKLEAEVQRAIFDTFKELQNDQHHLESYLSNAFRSDALPLSWAGDELEADTHRILVWHIATCLCEINLLGEDRAKQMKVVRLRSGPYIKETIVPELEWRHYVTAVSLSNYCAYLLTEALVPDNGLVVDRVLTEVRRETRRATLSTPRSQTLQDIYEKLMNIVSNPDVENNTVVDVVQQEHPENNGASRIATQEAGIQTEDKDPEEGSNGDPDEEGTNGGKSLQFVADEENTTVYPNAGLDGDNDGFDNTIIKMGSQLGKKLIDAYKDRPVDLWRDLAKFWTGFLLHLAAFTGAEKHKAHLMSNTELITHLWALLSHAGYLGNVRNGEEILDPRDQGTVNPLS